MAKTVTTQEIDGKNYRLHSVKANNVDIGFVPVLDCKSLEDLAESGYDEATILMDWRSGCAVRLQASARRATESKSMSQADFMRIAANLLAENSSKYVGKAELLQADAKGVWESEQDSGVVDSEKIWIELI